MGDRVVIDAKIAFDDSYPTNGEALANTDFSGLHQIDSLVVHSTNLAQYRVIWDDTNSKLKVYLEDATSGKEAEVGNTEDINTLRCLVQVTGK
tara:strand:+ start:478 stop:756 length:279 start_codon:yes stop_codon:yes gene_type:complete